MDCRDAMSVSIEVSKLRVVVVLAYVLTVFIASVTAACLLWWRHRRHGAIWRHGFWNTYNRTRCLGARIVVWQLDSAGYHATAGVGSRLLRDNGWYADARIDLVLAVGTENDDAAGDAGVMFRVADPLKQADGADECNGYYFGLDVVNQQVFLSKSTVGIERHWVELMHRRMRVTPGKAYAVTVKLVGPHIRCFVDDDRYPAIDISDGDHPSGFVGLWVNGISATVNNLTVGRYAEPSLDWSMSYMNPVLDNVADPDVLYHDGMYYLYPTTATQDVEGIKVYTSRDLVHWRDCGLAMKAGSDNWGSGGFWAPDITEREHRFYLTYTANEHLCVSVGDCPLGPFKQLRFGPMHPDIKEIDAHVFGDTNGQYYMYFVRFEHGNVIYGARLNDDMQSVDESTLTRLLVPSQPWEKDRADINEAPYMLEYEGRYFLTYSGSHFESPMYGVGYAVGDGPLGPFEKYRFNPILQSNAVVHGTGHHTFAPSPDGAEWFMLYHVHHDEYMTEPRRLSVDRVRFVKDSDGKTTLEVHGPTTTPQPIPSGAVCETDKREDAYRVNGDG
jgi:GH43 family beta-xylosidase